MSKHPSAGSNRHRLPLVAVLLLASFVLASGLYGLSDNPLRFRHLSIDDGLSQAAVYAIAQDQHGYVWFGTQEGLNRYDGQNFEVFFHDPNDPATLVHDRVWTLLTAQSGDLWIGTDGGLDRFDRETESFVHYRHDPANPSSLSNDRVWALHETADGTLWVGTDGGGVDVLDVSTGEVTERFNTTSVAALQSDRITYLSPAHDGGVWIATDGGGLVHRSRSGAFTAFRHDADNPNSLSEDRVRTVHLTATGSLWIGTYSGGLDRYTPGDGRFERLHKPGTDASQPLNRVRSVLEDSRSNVWVATDAGLEQWNQATLSMRSYHYEPADPYGLADNRVISLYEDHGGVLWVGTWGGLNKANIHIGHFAHYYRRSENPGELTSNVVTSFVEAPDKTLWIGTYGGGLNRFDRANNRFASASTTLALSDKRVMSLHADADNSLWVGTFGSGLDHYDPASRSVVNFRNDPEDPSSLSSNGIVAILRDSRQRLWIGTYGGGINRLRSDGRTFDRFQHAENDPSSLSGDRVLSLHEDRDGKIWVGVEDQGLNLFDEFTETFQRIGTDHPAGQQPTSPYSIHEDSDGSFWIASPSGLYEWTAVNRRARRRQFTHFGKAQGLNSSVVYGVLGDELGNLWLSTNRGLFCFDPKAQTFRQFDTADGLQSEEFNSGAFYRTQDGMLMFGGINGYNSFYPGQIRSNSHVPPVVLRSFRRLNHEVAFERPLSSLDEIEIDHHDRMITFEFAALDYTTPGKNRYRYRLDGFDEDWVDSGFLNLATYTNLNPGRYRFEVQAANADGIWNRTGKQIALAVQPPPWRTLWAYAGYAVVLLIALTLYSRSQFRKRRQAAKLQLSNTQLQNEVLERKRIESELRKLSLAVEQSPASVMITDSNGLIDYVNPKFEHNTGYSLHELRGRRFDSLQSGYASKHNYRALWDAVIAGHEWRGELHQRRKSGELLWEHASISPIFSEDGEITNIVAVNEDITVRKRYEERLLHQAHHDHLTGLPNRTLALDRLEGALARCRRSDAKVALLFVDLDNFKIVNDTMGHHAGDQLLKETANRLQSRLREDDTVARLGGDEFLIILNDLQSTHVAEVAARKLLEVFREPFVVAGREIFATASIGLTIAPDDGVDPHTLMSNADSAMYESKGRGRDAYRFFTPRMNEQALERLQIENNLRQAIDRDELMLKYQPIVEANTGRLVGCEALLRWHNAELGWVSPGRFIPVAEETGLVNSIGSWVIAEACRQIHDWRDRYGVPDLHVDVNISSRQLRSGDLAAEISGHLDHHSLPPSVLGLEVTEHALLEDLPQTADNLRRIQELGLRLSVDDFGTGYSALSNLKRYRFDALKIDQSFVRDLLTTPEDQGLTRAIIAMAESLGLNVIAEGVETREHLEMLREFGCPHAQGFYFSEALRPEEFEALLTDGDERLASAV